MDYRESYRELQYITSVKKEERER